MIDTGQVQLVVLLDMTLLHTHLPAHTASGLKQAALNHSLPAISNDVQRFGLWLMELLNETHQQPELSQHPAVVQSMEEEILRQLTKVVRVPVEDSSALTMSKRRQGLDRVLEYIRDADLTSLSIPQLSEIAGVGLRTLEYAFREQFDLTPVGFLRLQRFHIARRNLLAATPGETTVAHIAHDAGFYHLGHFSSGYFQLFGELPSATLNQRIDPTCGVQSPLIRPCS